MEQGAKVTPEPDVSGFSFYVDAFYELSSCRSYSMGIGSIPFTAIAEYAKIYEVDDFHEFLYIIRFMDNTFIRLNNGKRSSGRDNKDSGNRK